MSDFVFLFDLDSTLTKREILPEIAKVVGKEEEMRRLTEETMCGALPFKQSFLSRVELLKSINVSKVREIICEIPLNDYLIDFIKEFHERCYVVTGNLDIWISSLMKKINMENHYICSKAIESNDKLLKVVSVLDKELTVKQIVQPIVSVGDGDNDTDMARLAQIAIGYGGVRDIAPSLIRNIDYAFIDDRSLASFLRKLI